MLITCYIEYAWGIIDFLGIVYEKWINFSFSIIIFISKNKIKCDIINTVLISYINLQTTWCEFYKHIH